MKGLAPGAELAQAWVQLVHELLGGTRHTAYVLSGTPLRVIAQRGDLDIDIPTDEVPPTGRLPIRIRRPDAVHGQMEAVSGVVVGLGLTPDRAGTLLDPAVRLTAAVYRLMWDRLYHTLVSRALAHEVRNPLTLVAGYGELLSHRGEKAIAGIIVSEVERINQILEEFMATGRPLERRVVNLADAVAACIDRHADWVVRHSIEVERRLESATVWADPRHLDYIVSNLVRNAIESMPLGGTLTVRVNPIGGGAEAIVADTGPGIAPEARERLFQPYFTTKEKGHGLGLALAYDIAARHGGVLEVLPADKGAVFRLWIPERLMGGD